MHVDGLATPFGAATSAAMEEVIAKAPYGQVERLSPLVRRVLARNPSAFTFTGTGTYIVGNGSVAVIDPGPNDPAHLAALTAALGSETVSHIVVTHTHRDHSPAAVPLRAATGAPVVGCAPLALSEHGPKVEEGFDRTYSPDRVLADGEAVAGPGWTLRAVHTPGHTSNHLCFALEEEKALFSGDHVMGWSTSVVTPPDGDMAAYMASLRKLLDRDDLIYYPTHGPAVTDPKRLVRGLITHRKQRENQILKLLGEGPKPIPAMVATMYANVSPVLHPAAGRSVLAHLIDLHARGLVAVEGDEWRLAA
jgi:glyoxylase-like metal-dependent hydrolase (beta-lactamase superfamily II)